MNHRTSGGRNLTRVSHQPKSLNLSIEKWGKLSSEGPGSSPSGNVEAEAVAASQPCASWSRAQSSVSSSSWEQWRVTVCYIQLAGSADGSHLTLRLQECLWGLDQGPLTQFCHTVCGSKNSEIWNGLQFHIVKKGEKSYYPFKRKCIMVSWRKRAFVSCYLHGFDSTFTR